MMSFKEWFFNLLEAKKENFKRWTKPALKFYHEGNLPNHKKAMRIAETAGDNKAQRDAIRQQLFAILSNERTSRRYTQSYVIMAKPMACPRPRFTRFGRAYNPAEYTKWKKRIGEMVSMWDSYIFPIELELEFHFVTKSAIWGPHSKKPDIDNLCKAFMDAAQLGGLYADDSQVYKVTASKFYSYQEMIKVTITHHDYLSS